MFIKVELLYVADGECVYRTLQEEYRLRAGDAVFLNSGVLHSLEPVRRYTVTYANLFRKSFLSGGDGNYWDLTYLMPLLRRKDLGAVPFYDAERGSDTGEKTQETAVADGEKADRRETYILTRQGPCRGKRQLWKKITKLLYS